MVIDTGKTFQAASVEWFPKYGLRHIDAVLITHAHADGESWSPVPSLQLISSSSAMNGLDDLRGKRILSCPNIFAHEFPRVDPPRCDTAARRPVCVADDLH